MLDITLVKGDARTKDTVVTLQAMGIGVKEPVPAVLNGIPPKVVIIKDGRVQQAFSINGPIPIRKCQFLVIPTEFIFEHQDEVTIPWSRIRRPPCRVSILEVEAGEAVDEGFGAIDGAVIEVIEGIPVISSTLPFPCP